VLHQDYLDRIQTDLRRLRNASPSPTWRRTWVIFSRFEKGEPSLVGGPPFSTTTQTQTKSTHHLQVGAEEDSWTREPPLGGRPQFSTTTRNPMITPESFLGNHLGSTITYTPQGCFMYWKGLEPTELLEHDSRLVAESTLRRINPV
jgi:hypothetical protein